ncbi:unnamed protein product [Brassica rapa subsp. narinosa]
MRLVFINLFCPGCTIPYFMTVVGWCLFRFRSAFSC